MQTYTVNEVADNLKVTRQCIYLQIKLGKIKPVSETGIKTISLEEIARFKHQKYSRDKHFTDGYVSVKKAAKLTGITLQRIYYLIYNEKLKALRKNSMWFILEDDLKQCNVFGKIKGKARVRKIPHPNKSLKRIKRIGTLDKKGSEKEKAKKSDKAIYCKFKRFAPLSCKIDKNSPKGPRCP